jgi:[ribosomal protein S5]-alanine N-acetyltransferase
MNVDQPTPTFPVLETPRLVLRELRPDDAEDAFRFFSDEEAMRFYDTPIQTIDAVRELIPRHRQRFETNQAIRWAITIKGEDRVIGTCGYRRDGTSPETSGNAMMSYVLARPYWNQGYTTEALRAIIPYGFEHYGLHRIEAYVVTANPGSIRVLEKLGCVEEGRKRESFWFDGRFYDEHLFGCLPATSHMAMI